VSSAMAVLWRLLRAGPETPLDEQLELDRRAHLMVGFTFLALAVYIVWDAGGTLIRRSEPESSMVGVAIAIASLLAMPVLATLKSRAGKAIGSGALQADAVETWLCAYLSATLLVGLALNAWMGWWWADPAAALVMVPFIVWQGWDALAEARQD
jgi:divalent metal cation (Fe/Co/Zn/Cd) transporter